MTTPGRYCLRTCYCGECPHWRPFKLTGREWSRLFGYLTNPPSYHSGNPSPRWWRDPLGFDPRDRP